MKESKIEVLRNKLATVFTFVELSKTTSHDENSILAKAYKEIEPIKEIINELERQANSSQQSNNS